MTLATIFTGTTINVVGDNSNFLGKNLDVIEKFFALLLLLGIIKVNCTCFGS